MHFLPDSNIAIGFEWALHESLKAAKKAVPAKGRVRIARCHVGADCAQAIIPGANPPKNTEAGAILLALAVKDGLVFESLNNGNAWVCAVRDGFPLAGYDVVLPEPEANALFSEALTYMPGIDIYGNIIGAKESIEVLFGALTKKERLKARLINPRTNWGLVFLPFLIAGVGYGGMSAFEALIVSVKNNESELAAMLALQAQQALLNSEMEKKKANFHREVEEARSRVWSAVSAERQFDAWMAVYKRVAGSYEGWKTSGVKCSDGQCTFQWDRHPRASMLDAKKLPGELVEKSITVALTNISVMRLPESVFDHDVGAAEIIEDLSAFSRGYTMTLTPANDVVNVMPPEDVPELQPVALAREGRWTLTTTRPAVAYWVLSKMSLPGVRLNSVNMSGVRAGIPSNIILEGTYRVGQ